MYLNAGARRRVGQCVLCRERAAFAAHHQHREIDTRKGQQTSFL